MPFYYGCGKHEFEPDKPTLLCPYCEAPKYVEAFRKAKEYRSPDCSLATMILATPTTTQDTPIPIIRKFETGATRDSDEGKLDYEGFESPFVMQRFAEFMHENRKQKDGSIRGSDNWQAGIPKEAYIKSMLRHLMDVWLHHRGLGHKAKEPLEVALCALRFNVNGYLFEELKEKK
jgi:hypothetical protein